MFFSRVVTALTENDLDWLVANRISEDDRLDYKRDMYGTDDESKRELLRDITQLANHRGGRLLIGVDEDANGQASAVIGVPSRSGEAHEDWIRKLCLSSIEERIVGLSVTEIPLANGRVVLAIDVPESPNGPHLITFKGLNQFWKRHGRQKGKMTVDEIRDGFLRIADAQERIDRFLARRRSEVLEWTANDWSMALMATPRYFNDKAILDVRDSTVSQLMSKPPDPDRLNLSYVVSSGQPKPSLYGRKAEVRQPRSYLEVSRNGYVEFCVALKSSNDKVFAGIADSEFVVSFACFVQALYRHFLSGTPFSVRWEFFHAKHMQIAYRGEWTPGMKWPQDYLLVGDFAVEDVDSVHRELPRMMCDRLWNAFGHEESDAFTAGGTLRRS